MKQIDQDLHQDIEVEIPDELLEALGELERGEIYDLDSAFDEESEE